MPSPYGRLRAGRRCSVAGDLDCPRRRPFRRSYFPTAQRVRWRSRPGRRPSACSVWPRCRSALVPMRLPSIELFTTRRPKVDPVTRLPEMRLPASSLPSSCRRSRRCRRSRSRSRIPPHFLVEGDSVLTVAQHSGIRLPARLLVVPVESVPIMFCSTRLFWAFCSQPASSLPARSFGRPRSRRRLAGSPRSRCPRPLTIPPTSNWSCHLRCARRLRRWARASGHPIRSRCRHLEPRCRFPRGYRPRFACCPR